MILARTGETEGERKGRRERHGFTGKMLVENFMGLKNKTTKNEERAKTSIVSGISVEKKKSEEHVLSWSRLV